MKFFTVIILVLQLFKSSLADRECSNLGIVSDPDDCTQFHVCAGNATKPFLAEKVPCPEGYAFSSSAKTCIQGSEVPGCSVTHSLLRSRRQSEVTGACRSSGPYCESCDRLVVCATVGNALRPVTNISCSETSPELVCVQNQAACVESSTPCDITNRAGTFQCLIPGYFPDPRDCRKYHICTDDLQGFEDSCDFEYDAAAQTCKEPTGTDAPAACTSLNKDCATDPSPISFTSATQYYVICLPISPTRPNAKALYEMSVLRCPDNQVFDNAARQCMVSCNNQRGRFVNPNDCHSYFECAPDQTQPNNPITPQPKRCPSGLAFDSTRNLCAPESTIDRCRVATTPAPTTAVPTTVSGTTSRGGSSATTPSPGSSFTCTRYGRFENPTDCHRYYECSPAYGSNRFRLRNVRCPYFTYFDPRYGRCLYGICRSRR